MWPTASSFGAPFGAIPCPNGSKCSIPYCLFSHEVAKVPEADTTDVSQPSFTDHGHTSKRLKRNDGLKQASPNAISPPARTAQPAFTGSITRAEAPTPGEKDSLPDTPVPGMALASTSNGHASLLRPATRPISPPPKSTMAALQLDPPVPLTPRKLGKEPTSYTKRLALLKLLRASYAVLNEKVALSSNKEIKALKLTDNQLNKLAVDEEEAFGIQHRAVYENKIKHRLADLKKMTLDGWVKNRKEALEKERGLLTKDKEQLPGKKPPTYVNTGLSAKGEVELLSHFIADQTGLEAYGYVTKKPTEADVQEAREGLACAVGWERCERCDTRFQVFPERRAQDGAITTGGKCTHHWGRKQYPKNVPGQAPGRAKYSCCGEDIGTPGCYVHDTHVFGVKGRNRLSTVLPFMETPQNDKVRPFTAVGFDCEMGYTVNGLELMRLTAISWPSHQPLLDILVRPLGHILDLNTRFSGITPEQYFNAKPYDPANPSNDPKDLRIVDSPAVARDLFFSFISPSTPLLGHAIENDLNAVRVIHPNIVDTVLLYPHRNGLPMRHGLKNLARMYLKWDIQQAGAAGHDSFEDAKATGELVRFKLAQEVVNLRSRDWKIVDGRMQPPLPKDGRPPAHLLEGSTSEPVQPTTGVKRKHGSPDDGDYGRSGRSK